MLPPLKYIEICHLVFQFLPLPKQSNIFQTLFCFNMLMDVSHSDYMM